MKPYLAAFWKLCSKRTGGFGPNPISFQDIVLYAEVYDFDDLEEFESLISVMDEKWLSVMASRNSK